MRSVLKLAVVAAVVVAAPAQAADSCPNAQLRTGASAGLPDCRALEQVSPVDKNGVGMYPEAVAYASADGNRLFSGATGAVVPTDSGYQFRGFSSVRTGDWATVGTDAPGPVSPSIGSLATYAVSDDGSKALTSSPDVLADGGVQGATNLYVRDLTKPRAFTLLASVPGQAFGVDLGYYAGPIIDVAPDLSAVAISTAQQVLPDVPPPPPGSLYTYIARDGSATLESRLADGTPVPAYGVVNPPDEQHLLSDDGLSVLWQPYDNAALRRSTRGGGVVELGAAGVDPSVQISAPDASDTFFTGRALTPGSTSGSGAVYRYDAASGRLDDLTAKLTTAGSGATFTLRAVSADRKLAWFTSDRALLPDGGQEFDTRLYALDVDARTVELVARFDPATGIAGNLYRFSPDGYRVAIRTDTALANPSNQGGACERGSTGGTTGYCGQVYTWNARAPQQPVTCVSCVPGATQVATAGFGTDGPVGVGGRIDRAITDDGRVFFDTAAPLVGRDDDTASDVYQFTPGAGRTLLSAGGTGADAVFADATPDGRSVFFHTGQRLVPQDADELTDVYVARMDGGIAAQQVPPAAPAQPCAGDACRPAPDGSPARPVQGSTTITAPATPLVPRFSVTRPSAKTLRAAARSGRLTVAVKVNAPGTVAASLRGKVGKRQRTAASASRKASKAQTVRVPLRLSKAARRQLRRSGKLSLRLTVAYSERLPRYRTTLTIKKGGSR